MKLTDEQIDQWARAHRSLEALYIEQGTSDFAFNEARKAAGWQELLEARAKLAALTAENLALREVVRALTRYIEGPRGDGSVEWVARDNGASPEAIAVVEGVLGEG